VRVSDDLSPAEQARAARWAADWLSDAGFDVSETARDAMSALGCHADDMDPPVLSVREAADELVQHIGRMLDRWADMGSDHAARNRELWTPLHRKADVLADALEADDELDPPETVESLRAERDSARQDADGWETSAHEIQDHCDAALADVTHWREQFRLVCDESADRKGQVEAVTVELADTRTDLHKANAEVYRLRAAIPVADAAWGRCQRED